MQEATAEKLAHNPEVVDMPSTKEEPQGVSYWVTTGFRALTAICATLLISFGGWLVVSVNQINNSTSILKSEFTAYKGDIGELKLAVDGLRLRGESWATKDSLTVTKDGLREDISKIKDQLNTLEVRLVRLENNPPRR